jgi:hypothetical protein
MKLTRLFKNQQYPEVSDPDVLAELEKLRYQGNRGGHIFKHRSMLTLRQNRYKALSSILLALSLLVGWLLILNWVTFIWGHTLDFWREVLGLGGYVTTSHYTLWNVYHLTVPYLHLSAGPPDYLTLWISGLITILLFLVTFLIPRRHLPIIYLLRIIVFFHACAQVFFAFVPFSFPYGASGYVHGVLIAALTVISLIPVKLGLTYFVFDFGLLKKIGFSLMLMTYMCVFIPLQYLAHAFVMYHLSLLFLPVLFFVFGLPLNVMIFMGFYSWGASWKDSFDRDNSSQDYSKKKAVKTKS